MEINLKSSVEKCNFVMVAKLEIRDNLFANEEGLFFMMINRKNLLHVLLLFNRKERRERKDSAKDNRNFFEKPLFIALLYVCFPNFFI
jgi:hypothetical protein